MSTFRPPPHVGWLLRHGATGFAIGVVFGLGFVAFDVGHVLRLAMAEGSAHGPLALCFLCGLTCGGVQIGIAVMALGDDDHRGGGHRGRVPHRQMVLVPARAPNRPRR